MIQSTITSESARRGAWVLGTYIDALDWQGVTERILRWAAAREGRAVCLCNVHSAVTAVSSTDLRRALASSDMVLPDGAPIAWMLRRKGHERQTRLAGPDLMLRLCSALQETSIGVFLFGSSEETIRALRHQLQQRFPRLKIKGASSPRYGEWTQAEEDRYVLQIRESSAGVVFIGLCCPRQEIWIAKRSKDVPGVMIGVGAAFDFHAGTVKRAPAFMQKAGLEWLHRLSSEPKRLWRRYLTTNSRFIWLAARDLMGCGAGKKNGGDISLDRDKS